MGPLSLVLGGNMKMLSRVAVLLTAVFSVVACGGGGSSNPTPVPTPTPAPVRTVVAQGSMQIGAPDDDFTYYDYVTFNTSASGRLETTVNWTYPSNSVFMYVAEGDCTGDKFENDDCPGGPTCACRFSVMSEAVNPKPRVLTVSNASPGLHTLVLWNLGPREESCSYQAVLTTGVGSVAPAGVQSASVGSARKGLAKKRLDRSR
jgi:hypothetical protein